MMNITIEEKKFLLELAREEIAGLFQKSESPEADYNKYPVLQTKKGAFVTLTINSQLRGCIGYITSDRPLYETIKDAAIQAAIGDPRFPSLTKTEFENISIEISILSEPFPMNEYDDIEIGKHGLILDEGGRRGLLLPQVPVEHKMNREEFLESLCQKAGFHPGLWKGKKLDISMFTADVFSEKDFED